MNTPNDRNNREITARIAALLTHYWTAGESDAVRFAQMQDWIEDLAEFGPFAVGEACKEYRRGPDHTRRPLPGDIRIICIRLQAADAMRLEHRRDMAAARDPWPDWLRDLWGPEPHGPMDRAEAIERDKDRQREQLRRRIGNPNAKLTSEMTDAEKIAEGRRIEDEWAQERGFPTLDAYAAANGLDDMAAIAEVIKTINAAFGAVAEKTLAKKRGTFDWTAEQLKAGRDELVRLGHIEPPPNAAP